MKIGVTIILFTLRIFTYSQSISNKVFMNNEGECDSTKANYYFKYFYADSAKNSGIKKKFDLSHVLIYEKSYSNLKERIMNGTTKYYYPNGQLRRLEFLVDNVESGISKYFYPNGKLKSIVRCFNDSIIETKNFTMDGKDTGAFKETNCQLASYPGGESKLLMALSKGINYPQELKEKGISGTVFIQILVDEEGNGFGHKVIKHSHPLLDEEALRCAKLFKKWTPAICENEELGTTKYVFPIKFIIR